MRIQKQPKNYEPSMVAGKKYELGVLNLCYRDNKYKLKDGIISVNLNYCLSSSAAASYEFQARTQDEVDNNTEILRVIMVHQYNLKKGLELFGDKDETATVKELAQIHEMGTFEPLDAGELTPEQKAKALSSLMLIVEKPDGR